MATVRVATVTAGDWMRSPLSAQGQEAVRLVLRLYPLAGNCTPTNLRAEVARLSDAERRGQTKEPAFEYARHAVTPLRQVLASEVDRLESVAGSAPVRLYRERLQELADELAMLDALHEPDRFRELARQRFAPRPGDFDAEADAWAAAHVAAADVEEGELVFSCDERDPRSLLHQLRAMVSRRRIPFRVVPTRALAALAAVAEDTIFVAERQRISEVAARRTALHEVIGHAVPRANAALLGAPLLRLGTRHGSDDQEGYALCLESQHGFLSGARARELSFRHRAARAVHLGASYSDVLASLRTDGAPVEQRVRIACRTLRGGGLGREVTYLPAMLRVQQARRMRPDVARRMGLGCVSVEAAAELEPWLRAEDGPDRPLLERLLLDLDQAFDDG